MKHFLSTFFAVIIFNTAFSQAVPTITSFSPTSGVPGTTVVITGTTFAVTPTNNHFYFGAAKATVSASTSTSCTVTVPSGASFGPISITKPAASYTSYSAAFFNPTQNCPDAIGQTSFDTTSFATLNIAPYYINYGDIDLDGKPDMIVSERAASTTSYITIYRNTSATNGAITFATGVSYAVGSNIRNLAIGDLNADGKLDIACLNRTAGTVSILINASTVGTITFNTPVAYLVSSGPGGSGIAIGDLNKDGKPDIAVATGITTASDSIAVLQNLNTTSGAAFTSGSFASYVNYYSGNAIEGLCMGDIDGDGFDDIVCSNNNNNNISVFRNTSIAGGAISFAAKVSTGTGLNPLNISLGDVNADGKLDIAVANNATSGGISIIQNNSTPGVITLATDVIFSTGANNNGRDADITDINGDGKLDVIVAIGNADSVSVFININGTGTINSSFFSLVNYALPVSFAPRDVAAQDLNADGKTDFTTVSQVLDRITIFRNLVNGGPYMTSSSSATICSGNAVGLAYTATPSPTTYSWNTTANSSVTGESTGAQTATSLTNTLTINSGVITPVVLNYTITPSSTTCPGGVPHPQTVTVTVNPKPIITAITNTVCSGTAFTSTPVNTTNGTVPAGTTYSWSAPTVTGGMTGGAAGTNATSITGTLTNTTTTAQTATYVVTPTSGSCSGSTFTLTVTVNPKASITAMTNTVCSGTAFTSTPANTTNGVVPSGTTYSWSTPTVTGGLTGGALGSAASSITGTLTNTTTTVQTATYVITPSTNSCSGSTFTLTVSVNPKPVMTSATSTSVCSGSTMSFALTSNIASTYQWNTTADANISGESTGLQTRSVIDNTLTYTALTAPTTLIYTVTPTATTGACVGTQQTVTVTLNPKPILTSTSASPICSGESLSFPLTSATPSTYSWVAISNSSVTGESTSPQSTATITDLLVSSVSTATTVIYQVTPTGTAGSCVGSTINVWVAVNPKPIINAMTASICSGLAFTSTPVNSTNGTVPSGTTYSWSDPVVTGGMTGGASGTNATSVTGTLTNPTTTPQTATYIITPVSGTCTGTNYTLTVTVNPTPVMTSSSSTSVCSGTALNFALTSGATSTYSWLTSANTNVTGETTTATVSSAITNTLTSSLTSATTLVYTVTPTGTAGSCVGTTQSVTVTVNPKPVMTSATSTSVCSGTALNFVLTSGAAATYSWLTSVNANVSGETTTSTVSSAITNTLTSSLTSATVVVYTVTPTGTAGSCVGTAQSVSVTVNPKPVMTSATTYSICSGVTMNFPLTSGATSTYSWNTSDNISTTGESVLAQSGATINNTIVSSLTTATTLVYTVTPTGTTGACVGNAQNVTVTVNPKPTVTSASAKTICSGNSVALALTSATPSTYSWLSNSNTNVNGESTTSQTGSTITNTVTSTSTSIQTLTYTVTPTSTTGSCVGTAQTVTVTLDNLPPVASVGSDISLCSSSLNLPGNNPFPGTGNWTLLSQSIPTFTTTIYAPTTYNSLTGFNNFLTNDNATLRYTVASQLGVCPNTFDDIVITKISCPLTSEFTTSSNNLCLKPGETTTVVYTDNSSPGAFPPINSWTWTFNGGTPSSATGQGPHTITYSYASALTTYAASLTVVDNNSNQSMSTQLITVRPKPSAPSVISGSATVCQNDTIDYSVASILNADIYSWVFPTGASSVNPNNIASTIFSSTAQSGVIKVAGVNTCGAGDTSYLSVTVNQLPSAAGVISGTSPVCQGANPIAYSVGTIANATSYIWTFPTGISSAQTTSNINANFSSTAESGLITVKGSNTCGVGASSTYSVAVNPLPAAAGVINGTSPVCQSANGVSFTISPLQNATSYAWTLPAGATTSSTTESASINFSTTASSGLISVAGVNACGTGTASTYSVTMDPLPSAAGAISGPLTICADSNGVSYSVASIINADGYNWSFPSGVTSVNPNNIALTDFSANASSGVISVSGYNACGNGVSSSINVTVNPLPAAAGVITGLDSVCQGQNGVAYNIASILNASSYVWSTPSGSVTSGTENYSANFASNANSGNITVYGVNSCGTGAASNFAVVVNPLPLPPVFSGNAIIGACPLEDSMLFNFSTALYAESFNWILPAGAYANGATNNDSINIGFNSVGINDTLKVASVNGCGNSAYSYMVLNLQALTTPEICMVTVDEPSQFNHVYWDKSGYAPGDTFIVYREVTNNNYQIIGKVAYDSVSMFIDTLRTLYFPSTGNPNISSNKYKLAVEDSCGNISAMSLYHQTMFIQDQLNGNFNWNDYQIEGQPVPISQLTDYELIRDNDIDGIFETTVGSTTSNLITDPQYFTFQNTADWRVFTNWTISCDPTLRLSNDNHQIQTTVVKSKSNIKNNRTIGIASTEAKNSSIKIYPNPASNVLTVDLQMMSGEQAVIAIKNMLGQTIYSSKTNQTVNTIKVDELSAGVYFIEVTVNTHTETKKVVIEK